MDDSPPTLKLATASPVWRRKLLFAALYFSEGAPIGFIWFAIPVRLRSAGLPIEEVTWLASILVLPWMFKFMWAPLVDALRSQRWTFRQWIYASQTLMGLTLLPLLWLDGVQDIGLLAAFLLIHGVAAATQDVAVDALCIASTTRTERGDYNGWMQAGVLLGRSIMGGGVLAMYKFLGHIGAVSLLISITLSSMALLMATSLPTMVGATQRPSFTSLARTYRYAFSRPSTWWGIAFALVAGAAIKSFDVMYGVYLVDRGFSEESIGAFTAGPMIGAIVVGSLAGGWLADRVGCFRFVGIALTAIVSLIALLACFELLTGHVLPVPLFALLLSIGAGIGVFTAASYALFMNLTLPGIAATQFSTFMGAINGCEAWSVFVLGLLVSAWGYGPGFLTMCFLSLLALPMLGKMSAQVRFDEQCLGLQSSSG